MPLGLIMENFSRLMYTVAKYSAIAVMLYDLYQEQWLPAIAWGIFAMVWMLERNLDSNES